jgi:hypothetical protein
VTPQEIRRPPRPVNKAAPTRMRQPGDLICGECGEGNPPNRRFCSRCGHSLVDAERCTSHGGADLPAPSEGHGDRRGRGRGGRRCGRRKRSPLAKLLPMIRRVVAIALLVGGIVYASVPPFRRWVNERALDAKSRVLSIVRPQYTPVHPFPVTDQSELSGHPGAALSDGFTNAFWAAPVGDKDVVTLQLDHPTQVQRALIRIGISGNSQGASRPHQLHLVFSTGKTQDLNLDDTADPQEVAIKADGPVTTIELHVTSLFKASSDTVAITEIELFEKK